MSDYKPKFPSKYYQQNQLTPELIGLHALNPLFYTNSPSRNAMMASHWSQRLVIKDAEEPIIQSMVEADWANYTFAVRMPENGRVIKVIDQYPPGVAKDSLNYNPNTVVIYEKDMGPSHIEDRELDIFFIPDHLSLHQYFGFHYKPNKNNLNKLFIPGNFISKGTIFADTPAKNDDGAMMPGINLNTCLMSVPGVEEDGFVVCSDILPSCAIDIFEKRSISFGADMFALNLLGTETNYKAFPDIGEDLRPDGLLMMLRKYNTEAAPALMSVRDVMEPDFYFDQGLYARGGSVPIELLEKKYMETLDQPNKHFKQSLGRVVGIKVVVNNSTNKHLPDLMWPQINKYANAYKNYQKELLDAYNNLKMERKRKYGTEEMKLSPKLTTVLQNAMTVLDVERKRFSHSINLSHRTNPIDEVHIEFTIKYRIIPTIGFKFSDYNGGKGVICEIWPSSRMPVDEKGKRADVIISPDGTIGRMILAKPYLHQMGSASRQVQENVQKIVAQAGIVPGKATEQNVLAIPKQIRDQAYDQILLMQDLIDPRVSNYYRQMSEEKKADHLSIVINKEAYMACPIDVEKLPHEIVSDLEDTFKPTYGPVSYIGESGKKVTTHYPVRIAPFYFIMLEKIGDDWSAVPTGRLQVQGVLTTPTRSEKFSTPFKLSPVRAMGETEFRLVNSTCGRLAVAETIDRSNNIAAQRNMVWNIQTAVEPANIKNIVDRSFVNYGDAKPIQLFRHMAQVAGFEARYVPEAPYEPVMITPTPNPVLSNKKGVKNV